MKTLLILFPHQLFKNTYLDDIFNETHNKVKKYIILWEHDYFFTRYKFHKMKLVFHRCTMQKYYDDLKKYKKLYINNIDKNHENIIMNFIKDNKIQKVIFFNPIEKDIIKLINNNNFIKNIEKKIYPSPYFLNSYSDDINTIIIDKLNTIRHDSFYKYQRIYYNVMITKINNKIVPEGNNWSFDKDNRNKFEKNQIEPKILKFDSTIRNKYISTAIEYININFNNNYGECLIENFIYPIDNDEASKWLIYFVKYKLDNFGKYEDAISSNIKFGFHSLLSALNNIGLITTHDILKKIKSYNANLSSKEGFIRQIIGWREYCYLVYDKFSDKLITTSFYNKNDKKIPLKFWNGETMIPIIDNIIKNINTYAYSHHIERLMCIGNFLILIGIDADEIYNWFQTMYIDSYDVFMIPNVYGMLLYAKLTDTNFMMTRPYLCSSNYLLKMSNYKSTIIEINSIKYKWTDIFDALYYNHINIYYKKLSKIYAFAPICNRWMKFTDKRKKDLIKIANMYIDFLNK